MRPPAGVTWIGEPGAVIDGGWDGKTDVAVRSNGVTVTKPDVTIRGFLIRNVPGTGVAVASGGHRFTMEDCAVDNCYGGGFGVNGQGVPVNDTTLRRVQMTRLSRSWVVQKSPTDVPGCCLARWGPVSYTHLTLPTNREV